MRDFFAGIKTPFLVLGLLLLTGCAATPQPTVTLDANSPITSNSSVSFFYAGPNPDKATTHIFGASCLLCYGVAAGLTQTLDSHLEATISTDELSDIKETVLANLNGLAGDVVEVSQIDFDSLKSFDGGLGFAKKDFTSLKEQLGTDFLSVLSIYRHGAYRGFNSYFPTTDPQGHVAGILYTVDLTNNRLVQFLEFDERVQPQGEWDEPPAFPSVTTSYYQATQNVKTTLNNHLVK
ncbi:hypothetical protein [Grimontia sp. SpTr1]|uniref:hypothetical protein n=1 Tax=Grimontia sp. SpTr1 TaxID=2995319 RepID=UPI00248BB640|nr:hypothetical protein [Grimontia sp. SpTr1]